MMSNRQSGERLIPALPQTTNAFVNEPEHIDRILVRLWPDGTIYFNSNRQRIEEFVSLCGEVGVRITLDHISMCG